MTNHHHPVAHVLLGVGRHVVSAVRRLHVEHVLELNTLTVQAQPRVDLLNLVQVDGAFALPAAHVGVVFEKELAGQLALLQREPPTAPSLQEEVSLSGGHKRTFTVPGSMEANKLNHACKYQFPLDIAGTGPNWTFVVT